MSLMSKSLRTALILAGLSEMSLASDLDVNVSPSAKTFVAGTAIAMKLSITNVSPSPLDLTLAYPDWLGLAFHSKDKEVRRRQDPEIAVDKRIPSVQLAPGSRYETEFALNRYLVFPSPKKYTVEFDFAAYEPLRKDAGQARKYIASGTFEIEITKGEIDSKEIEQFEKTVQGSDSKKAQVAAEMLLWFDAPKVIAPLKTVGTVLPQFAPDAIRSLVKFIKLNEAQEAILLVGQNGNVNTLREALRAFHANGIHVPTSFYRAVLASKDRAMRYAVLVEDLATRPAENYLPLVEPLLKDPVPEIRDKAAEYVGKTKSNQ